MSNNSFISSFNIGTLSNKLFINIRLNSRNIRLCKSLYLNNLISSYNYNYKSKQMRLCFNPIIFHNKMSTIKQVSKASRKVNISIKQLNRWKYSKSRFFILSTDKGILTSSEALAYGIGGELLFIFKY